MALRKKKSRKQQVAELASDYLKLKAVTKTAKGAGKAAKRTPMIKRIPVILGVGLAALGAVKAIRGRSEGEPSAA
mgnify:CR=1 FL=1